MEAASLAATVRARLAEAGRDRDDDGVLALRRRELELTPLGDGALVDVAGEDQVGARLDEPREHAVPLRDRLLARAPGRPEQVVVEGDDPVRGLRDPRERVRRRAHLGVAEPSGLVPPRPHGVEARDDDRLRAVDGLGRLPEPLELVPGPREALREGVRDVVVAGDRHERQPEPAKEVRRALVLAAQAAVGEVAARDHELGPRLARPAGPAPRAPPACRSGRSGGLRRAGHGSTQSKEAIQSNHGRHRFRHRFGERVP